jgi:4-amino-4-deoxychorismate lyase
MNKTMAHFCPGADVVDIGTMLKSETVAGKQKCRVVYSDHIEEVSYEPYQMHEVKSLMIVDGDDVDYMYKSTDRLELNELRTKRGVADEVLIVKKDEITDTSYTNVALWDGSEWFTPVHPLLEGTCRAALIDQGILHERVITRQELQHFSKIALINAMINLGELEVAISDIFIDDH